MKSLIPRLGSYRFIIGALIAANALVVISIGLSETRSSLTDEGKAPTIDTLAPSTGLLDHIVDQSRAAEVRSEDFTEAPKAKKVKPVVGQPMNADISSQALPTVQKVDTLGSSTALVPVVERPKDTDVRTQAYTTLHSCQLNTNETITLPTVPYLIIIGAQKGGTTSMAQWLQEHPQIQEGRFPKKRESHFFHGVFAGLLEERAQKKWIGTDEQFYCWARQRYAEVVFEVATMMDGMVDGRNPAITFDKTPVNIHLKNCPEYVAKICTWGAKILVLLRNPVDRAYSQHQMDIVKTSRYGTFEERIREEVTRMRKVGLNDMPLLPINATMEDIEALDFPSLSRTPEQEQVAFEQLIKMPLLKKGLYAIQLREWLKWIPRSDIFIQLYEDLKRDPDATYRTLQQWLGLQDHSLQEYSRFKAGNYGPMNPTTRRYLERLFEPYNRQMEDLFGNDWRGIWKAQ